MEGDEFSARFEEVAVSASQSQAPPPIPESRTHFGVFLPPGAAYEVGSPGSYTFKQGAASTQPPSKQLPAVLIKESDPSMNRNVRPPRTYEHAGSNSIQYSNGRTVAENHDNGGEGSIHSDDRDKSWARGFFGSSREKEREREAQKELTRMIGPCPSAQS